jgi:hypothetical protein
MTHKRLFRAAVALSILSSIASALAAQFPGEISADWISVLEWRGDGSVGRMLFDDEEMSPQAYWGWMTLLALPALLHIASMVGLLFFWRPARTVFALLTILGAGVIVIDGLVVLLPAEAAFYELTVLLNGAIIAMSYLEPIKTGFESKRGVVLGPETML